MDSSDRSSTSEFTPRVHVTPKVSLIDEDVEVEISGLNPGQHITLHALLIGDKKEVFESFAEYVADDDGDIFLVKQPSLSGFYVGVEPNGFLWSMRPAPGQMRGLRLFKRDVTLPYEINLRVYDGAVIVDQERNNGELIHGKVLAKCNMEKWYMKEGVKRVLVKEGRVRGSLFLPPGDGQFQGVIDMFGTAGGLLEYKAALLASHGFATLALAFFRYDNLPETPADIDIEYFLEAIDWFSKHPKVLPCGIGVQGVSRGAQLALMMAAIKPQVKAVVSISPAHCFDTDPISYKGELLDFLVFDEKFVRRDKESGGYILRDCLTTFLNPPRSAEIPVEDITGHVLLLCGQDDQSYDSHTMCKIIKRKMEKVQKGHLVTMISYPETGHLIEPPKAPVCPMAFHRLVGECLMWGGKIKPHADAQEHSWTAIINFFRTNLVPTLSCKL